MKSIGYPQTSKNTSILPGFSLTCGITLGWLGFMVLFPIISMIVSTAGITWSQIATLISRPAAIASFVITLKYAFFTALINSCIGFILAWTITRYKFTGSKLFDTLIDLPFALPGAVGGIALASVFGKNGIIGKFFATHDIQLVYNQFGILIGLMFVTLPFAVRSVQPLIAQLDTAEEQAAYLLGGKSWHIFFRIQLPHLIPGIVSGFILSFARSIGEYGTVIFVAGNIPLKSEVISRYIYNKIDQYDIDGAMVTASVLLGISFTLLIIMNVLQKFVWKRDV